MTSEELIALNEEIAGMARAGLPLDRGLAALAQEMERGRLREVTAHIAEDLRRGRTLPEALESQGGHVPPYYASLVTAGVRTGRIGDVLTTLSVYARSMANLRAIIIDALFYPIVVLCLAVTMIIVLFVFILPRFENIFRDFNMRLPALTEGLMSVGRHPLLYVALPIAVVLTLLLLVRFSLRATASGRRSWARFVYAIPLIGTLVRSARLAAFTDLLAILIDHEIPLPEAFGLAGAASSDPLMAASAREIHQALQHGLPLGEVLQGQGLVPEWVAWMTGLGEKRGNLGVTLHQVAEMYRRQVQMRAGLVRNILPGVLIVATAGVFVAGFVLALMMPLVQLLEGLSK
jgi:type II secretory pathway component PulF